MNKKQQQVLLWTQSHWNSYTLLEEMQSSAVTLENDLAVSYKMKLTHTIWPNHPTIRYLSKRNENLCSYKSSYSVLFTFAQNCKQLKFTSYCEWINKLWYLHIIEYYYTIQQLKWMIHTTTQNLKFVLLSERSQTQKVTYYIIPFIWDYRKDKPIGQKRNQLFPGIGGWCEWLTIKGKHEGTFGVMDCFVWHCDGGNSNLHLLKSIELNITKNEFYNMQI